MVNAPLVPGGNVTPQPAQSYPVLLITLYLYINSILKIIRKSCVINLLRYISLYNIIMKSTYMCFLKDFKENRPRLALILRLTAIVGIDMIYNKWPLTSVSTPILAGSL